ncbi:hypothetical protein D770_11820 [Flammeovirgaceae bacterium 311]|nr:hypothetical protein D770_11820 [Flammeovirgaceae bacterium 311]
MLVYTSVSLHAFAQNRETVELVNSIRGQWEIDQAGRAIYNMAVEMPGFSKDELFFVALGYIHERYGNQGILEQNQEQGKLRIKGTYTNVQKVSKGPAIKFYLNTSHEIHFNVEADKVYIQLYLTGYHTTFGQTTMGAGYAPSTYEIYTLEYNIEDLYPIGPHVAVTYLTKSHTGAAFYESHMRAVKTMMKLEDLYLNY